MIAQLIAFRTAFRPRAIPPIRAIIPEITCDHLLGFLYAEPAAPVQILLLPSQGGAIRPFIHGERVALGIADVVGCFGHVMRTQ
jgi:hypothetical protein